MAGIPKPVIPGNIDVTKIAPIKNPDGSYSTVRSISIGTDSGEVLIPTVINGRIVADSTAIRTFRQTGKHLGVFKNATDANKFANDLHNREAKRIAQSTQAKKR